VGVRLRGFPQVVRPGLQTRKPALQWKYSPSDSNPPSGWRRRACWKCAAKIDVGFPQRRRRSNGKRCLTRSGQVSRWLQSTISGGQVIRKPRWSFKTALASFEDTNELDSTDREHISRWAGDDRSDEAWSKIWKRMQQGSEFEQGFARVFIRHVLAVRRVAESDHWPNFLRYADEAESLSQFLSGRPFGRLRLPPIPELSYLVPHLEIAAQRLREVANNSSPVSRKYHDGLRPRTVFMRMIAEDVRGYCGHPLNEVVCVLTDVAFPGQETTVDQVQPRSQQRYGSDRAASRLGGTGSGASVSRNWCIRSLECTIEVRDDHAKAFAIARGCAG
jgi:hypothetical protein